MWSSTEQQNPPPLNPIAQEFFPQGTSGVPDRHHLFHGADEEQDENPSADMGELDGTDCKDDIENPGECVDSLDNEILEEIEQRA